MRKLIIIFIYAIIYYNIMFHDIIKLNLTKHRRKEIEKREKLISRLTYWAYRNVIPTFALSLYYGTIIAHFLVYLIAVCVMDTKILSTIIFKIIDTLFLLDVLQLLLYFFLSWCPGKRGLYHGQWATKKRK